MGSEGSDGDTGTQKPRMVRYVNDYPSYTASRCWGTFEEARSACGYDPMVTTLKLVEVDQSDERSKSVTVESVTI